MWVWCIWGMDHYHSTNITMFWDAFPFPYHVLLSAPSSYRPYVSYLWDCLYSSCRYQRNALARPRGHRLTLNLVTKDLVNGIQDQQGLEKCDTDIWSQSFCCLVTRRTSQFKGPDIYLPKAKQKPRNVSNSQDSLLLVTSGLRRVDQRWCVELKPELRKHSLRSGYNSQGPPPSSAHSVFLILLSLS